MKTMKELIPNKFTRYTVALIIGCLVFSAGTRVGGPLGEALYYLTH